MLSQRRYTVIGGDLRNIKLANLLSQEGNDVNIFGFNNASFELGAEECDDLNKCIKNSEIVIGPIPCSTDNETINTPFNSDKIYINDIFKMMSKNQLFIAGRISSKIEQLSKVYNVYSIDLLDREELAILNAIPTAEGAIQIAMEETPKTLHNSKILVLGFGRIGKVLAKMLHGIGANVYVEARKYMDLAWIKSYGYNDINLSDLKDNISGYDIIFNTIPSIILDAKLLEKIDKDCLIIDLASKPGGVDFNEASKLGLKTIWALSLPGKVAPLTAASIINNTIHNILEDLGV